MINRLNYHCLAMSSSTHLQWTSSLSEKLDRQLSGDKLSRMKYALSSVAQSGGGRSSSGLSGIVSSEYIHAQSDIERVLVRNVNEILPTDRSTQKVERISEIPPLIQTLVDEVETWRRKLRIANDKLIDIELSGVRVTSNEEVQSTHIHLLRIRELENELQRAVADRDEIMRDTAMEIDELTNEVNELRRRDRENLQRAQDDLGFSIREAERVNLILESRNKVIETLEESVEDLRRGIQEKESVLLEREDEVEELKSELMNQSIVITREKQAEIDRLNRELNSNMRTIKALETDLAFVSSRLKQPAKELDVVRDRERQSKESTEVAVLLSSLRKKTAAAKSTTTHAEVSATASELAARISEMASLQDQVAKHRRRVAELESVVSSKTAENEVLQSKLREKDFACEKREMIVKLEEQLAGLTGGLRQAEAERDEGVSTITRVMTELASSQDRLRAAESQLELARQESDRLQRVVDMQTGQIGAMQQQITSSVTLSTATESRCLRDLNSLSAELEILSRQSGRDKVRFEAEVDSLRHQLVEAETSNQQLKQQLSVCQEELAVAGMFGPEIDSLRSKLNEAEIANAVLKEQLATTHSDSEIVRKSEAELDLLRMQLVESKTASEQLKHALSTSQGFSVVAETLEAEVDGLRTLVADLGAATQQLTEQLTTSQDEMAIAEFNRLTLEAELVAVQSQYKSGCDKIASLEKQVAEQAATIAQAKQDEDADEAAHQDMMAELSFLRQTIREVTEEVSQLKDMHRDDLLRFDSEISHVRQDVTDQENMMVAEMQDSFSLDRSANESMWLSRLEGFGDVREALESAKEEIARYVAEIAHLKEEIEATAVVGAKEVIALRHELEDVRDELEAKSVQVESLTRERDEALAELARDRVLTTPRMVELELAARDAAKDRASAAAEIWSLKEQAEKRSVEVDKLSKKVEELSHENESKAGKLEKLTKRIVEVTKDRDVRAGEVARLEAELGAVVRDRDVKAVQVEGLKDAAILSEQEQTELQRRLDVRAAKEVVSSPASIVLQERQAEKLRLKLDEVTRDRDVRSAEVAKLNEELQAVVQERDVKSTQVIALEKAVQDAVAVRAELQRRLDEHPVQSAVSTQVVVLEDCETEHLTEEVAKLNRDRDARAGEVAKLKAELDEVARDRDSKSKQIEALVKAAAESATEYADLQRRFDERVVAAPQQNDEIERLRSELKSVEQEMDIAVAELRVIIQETTAPGQSAPPVAVDTVSLAINTVRDNIRRMVEFFDSQLSAMENDVEMFRAEVERERTHGTEVAAKLRVEIADLSAERDAEIAKRRALQVSAKELCEKTTDLYAKFSKQQSLALPRPRSYN